MIHESEFKKYVVFTSKRALRLSIFLLLSIAGNVLAQNSNDNEGLNPYEDWYQVEILIFERSDYSADKAGAEAWPKNVELKYPKNLEFLLSDRDLQKVKAAEQFESNKQELPPPGEPVTIQQQPKPAEIPFYRLPESSHGLDGTARAFKRKSGYRVLFHQAWRQPVLAVEEAPAIVIYGGNEFDKNRELEGTITLSKARYLHIYTDLWLSKFQPNYGVDRSQNHWPKLPPRPSLWNPNPSASVDQDSPLQDEKRDLLTSQANEDTPQNADSYIDPARDPYVVTKIVTLKQKRRMRSGELHYIDHPKMGILIFMEPYNPESKTSAISTRSNGA